MEHSKLSEHLFKKGKFSTPIHNIFKDTDRDDSWIYGRMPEYIWMALILQAGTRKVQIKKCMDILSGLSEIVKDSDSLFLPKMSDIFRLSDEQQKSFYRLLESMDLVADLKPLTVVFTSQSPIFNNYVCGYTLPVKTRIDILQKCLEPLSDKESDLTNDVKFLIVFMVFNSGKLKVAFDGSVILEAMTSYPALEPGDSKLGMYSSSIRATEQVLVAIGSKFDDSLVGSFWKHMSLLSDCELISMEIKNENQFNLIDYKTDVHDTLKYYVDVFQEEEPLDEKILVLLGIAVYAYKRIVELADHSLGDTIAGRSIMRGLCENYVMMKYLLKKSEDPQHKNIWREFQYYGIGQYKLIYERYREDDKVIEHGHINFDYVDALVSEFTDKEFIDMDTRYFGNGTIRNKFKEVGEDNLWKYNYDYDSQFEHGFWGAIRESSLLKCTNPSHQYHDVPDIENEQRLPDVSSDAKKIMDQILAILKQEFGSDRA
ncbi:DUF5677 domain-containing protein [Oenococcus oeni]|uniref:DUF5677 domain-containing protein n=1 Tax=Oenococcus oeni TaxID=1247 RepID=UPI0008F91365|nr:DUF5677 domain-containing protein [Oenococcus oeni]OIK85212.1 hypothetical protein ATW78_07865 [Oenococcus oeni]OIL34111.1 hypothetical protein ATX08_07935 [Oenococcus oeni]OLQ35064.1 hypothetical protein ATX09_07400 [Oenococcus oeni]